MRLGMCMCVNQPYSAPILWGDSFANITMVVNVHGEWNFLRREKPALLYYSFHSIDKDRVRLKFGHPVAVRNSDSLNIVSLYTVQCI